MPWEVWSNNKNGETPLLFRSRPFLMVCGVLPARALDKQRCQYCGTETERGHIRQIFAWWSSPAVKRLWLVC